MATISPALRRLTRELRYRPLPALVGWRMLVTSFDEVEEGLREQLQKTGLTPEVFDGNNFGASISKYDLMDVSFVALKSELDHPDTQRGIPALRDLGYLDSLPDDESDTLCLDMLVEDIDSGGCCIKLFLVAETERDRKDPAVLRQMIRLELPDQYFPRFFVVHDACVTNASGIWLWKHLWL